MAAWDDTLRWSDRAALDVLEARRAEAELRFERMRALQNAGRRFDTIEGFETVGYAEGFAAGLDVAAGIVREPTSREGLTRNEVRAARGDAAVRSHPDFEPSSYETYAADLVADVLHAVFEGAGPREGLWSPEEMLAHALRVYEGDAEDDDEDETAVTCSRCGAVYDETRGDGYCGLCPACADATEPGEVDD